MSEEQLITLGQLLKIKREKMGLNLTEAENQLKITGLINSERNINKPGKDKMAKFIKFYNITDEEMKSLKPSEKHKHKAIEEKLVCNAIDIINTVLQRVGNMSEKGLLASSIKKDTLENLNKARELLIDIQIVDLLI